MDLLDPLPNKERMGEQSSAQIIEEPSGIESTVTPGANRRVLYFSSQSKVEVYTLIKDR